MSQALAATTYVGSLVVVSKLTMLASLMFPKASTYKSAKIIKGLPLSEGKKQKKKLSHDTQTMYKYMLRSLPDILHENWKLR